MIPPLESTTPATASRRVMFSFPSKAANKPVVSLLIRDYRLNVNIFRAKVNQDDEGFMILDITGDQNDIEEGLKRLESLGVSISENQTGLVWDEKKCSGCGNCITHCPTGALHIPDRKTMKVIYDSKECVECLNCVENCPFGACSSLF